MARRSLRLLRIKFRGIHYPNEFYLRFGGLSNPRAITHRWRRLYATLLPANHRVPVHALVYLPQLLLTK